MIEISFLLCSISIMECMATLNTYDLSDMSQEFELNPIAPLLKFYKIIPNIIPKAPVGGLKVYLPADSLFTTRAGKLLSIQEFGSSPFKLIWETKPNAFYAISFFDADLIKDKDEEWLHWLKVNIPGNNTLLGDTLCTYVGYYPQKYTDLVHRYIIFVYEQPSRINFTEPAITDESGKGREGFKMSNFAKKYNLGLPIACSFFLSGPADPVFYELY